MPLRWRDLMDQWGKVPALQAHTAALRARFAI
jgi:hypothetical protein